MRLCSGPGGRVQRRSQGCGEISGSRTAISQTQTRDQGVDSKYNTGKEQERSLVPFQTKRFVSSNRFLLAILQLQSVLKFKDPVKVKDRLRNLPDTPTEAYHDLLDRMTPEDQDLARRVLGWVLLARRILKMAELREVLALNEEGSPSLDVNDCLEAEQVVSICGGLIIHNRGNDLVTFSHETVRPFLETHELTSLPSHSLLSSSCLAYLRLLPFGKPCDFSYLNKMIEEFKFSEYAAKFWATHAVQAGRDGRLELSILETFKSDGRREVMGGLKSIVLRYRRESLLQVLIESALSFIFTSPVSRDEQFQTMHVLLS